MLSFTRQPEQHPIIYTVIPLAMDAIKDMSNNSNNSLGHQRQMHLPKNNYIISNMNSRFSTKQHSIQGEKQMIVLDTPLLVD